MKTIKRLCDSHGVPPADYSESLLEILSPCENSPVTLQVYKHFLTDKVLRDPRQKRFFKARDLRDLFTLGDEYQGGWGWQGW